MLIVVVVGIACTVGDGRRRLHQWWAIDEWHLHEIRSPGPRYLQSPARAVPTPAIANVGGDLVEHKFPLQYLEHLQSGIPYVHSDQVINDAGGSG